jgi:hypothetical protein
MQAAVLVIGLGSGITAGSVAAYDGVERLTIIEISPEVVAASAFFEEDNGDVLADPRVELLQADARNYLLADKNTYDVIISEPSNPWISGIANLYTREFFELAKSHLSEDGIMSQWFHMYSMSPADLKSVLQTFQAVFPHVSVWEPQSGDLVIIGSNNPHQIDYSRFEDVLGYQRVQDDLRRIGIYNLRDLAEKFVMSGTELANYTAGAPLNTDSRPLIEFNAPRNLYAETLESNSRDMILSLGNGPVGVPIAEWIVPTMDGISAPVIDLAISAKQSAGELNWKSDWLIDRSLADSEDGGGSQSGVATKHVLSWREGDVETLVESTPIRERPAPAELRDYLDSLITGRVIRDGQVDMPGGNQGFWLLAQSDQPGQIELAAAWTCVSGTDEIYRQIAYRRVPDPGQEGWETALVDLISRFHCKTFSE